jgi:hypothetical protein
LANGGEQEGGAEGARRQYQYIATLEIPDPDDPTRVWSLRSRPRTINVFTVLEATQHAIGPAGGTVASAAYPDAPRLYFPKNTLTAPATVTYEILSLTPSPFPNIRVSTLGLTAYLRVDGARLAEDAVIHVVSEAPLPTYPHNISGSFSTTGRGWTSYKAIKRLFRKGYSVCFDELYIDLDLDEKPDIKSFFIYVSFFTKDLRPTAQRIQAK